MSQSQQIDPEIETWRRRFVAYLQQQWESTDGAHDLHHLHRVWRTSQNLATLEGNAADLLVLLTACYFHDFVAIPKDSADRSKASLFSADKAVTILIGYFQDFPADKLPAVHHAIHAHSFSAQVPVNTIEAAILQDADRMEALGAIGLARMFYTAGKMSSELFHPQDPLATQRPLDDTKYSLDHIEAKLLKLPAMMNTAAGRELAKREAEFLKEFRLKLEGEVTGSTTASSN